MQPLVSVICLCHNHEPFLAEALHSVLAQTYTRLQIIIVDDASTDGSREIILEFCSRHSHLQFIPLNENLGTCRAFNHGWRAAKGAFIVDFATDDVMLPTRLAEQVRAFQSLGPEYGVVYTNAEMINARSEPIGYHYHHNWRRRPVTYHPSGNVYEGVLRQYFICHPTLMSRREVFAQLEGYDEDLAYEDFDFWVRSSREFYYHFLNRPLTKRRIHASSQSTKWFRPGDRQLASTVKVCWKAAGLNRTPSEHQALVARVEYTLREAFFTENFAEAEALGELLRHLTSPNLTARVLAQLTKAKIRLGFVRRWYHKVRYGR